MINNVLNNLNIELSIYLFLMLPLISALISFTVNGIIRNFSLLLLNFLALALSAFNLNYLFTHPNLFICILKITTNFSLSLYLEPIGAIFTLFVSFLWFVNNIYTFGFIKSDEVKNSNKLLGFISLSIFATFLSAIAGNLITAYLGYELLTLLTFPLVNFYQKPESEQAAIYYLKVLLGTSILFLLPCLILSSYELIGNFNETTYSNKLIPVLIPLLLFGTAKVAPFPFHLWLPKAMVAPIPVSALLHAVAVVKTGIIFILRYCNYKIGFENLKLYFAQHYYFHKGILWFLFAQVIICAIYAIRQKSIKGVLAYSTISNLSLILIPIFYVGNTAKTVFTCLMLLISHGLIKISLFFSAGNYYSIGKIYEVIKLQGMGKNIKYNSFIFLFACFVYFEIIPSSHLVAKHELHQLLSFSWFDNLLYITTTLGIIYLSRPLFYLCRPVIERPAIKKISLLMYLAPVIALSTAIIIFYYIDLEIFVKLINSHKK